MHRVEFRKLGRMLGNRSGPAHDGDMRQFDQPLPLVPLVQAGSTVPANDEHHRPVSGLGANLLQRVDHPGGTWSLDFAKVDAQAGQRRRCQAQHLDPMMGRRDRVIPERRLTRRQQTHVAHAQPLADFPCRAQMAKVDRVERPSKYTDHAALAPVELLGRAHSADQSIKAVPFVARRHTFALPVNHGQRLEYIVEPLARKPAGRRAH